MSQEQQRCHKKLCNNYNHCNCNHWSNNKTPPPQQQCCNGNNATAAIITTSSWDCLLPQPNWLWISCVAPISTPSYLPGCNCIASLTSTIPPLPLPVFALSFMKNQMFAAAGHPMASHGIPWHWCVVYLPSIELIQVLHCLGYRHPGPMHCWYLCLAAQQASFTDYIKASIADIAHALQFPSPNLPFLPLCNS